MTDYLEEQKNEIEALQSIYPEELEIQSTAPYHSFTLIVKSQSSREDVEHATCELQFTYTPKYPDELPTLNAVSVDNLSDEDTADILVLMKRTAEENIGCVVVFVIFSAVQDKLNEIVERIANDKLAEKERKEREVEELERKKFEGTRVTIETFLAWQKKFDAEMAEIRRIKTKCEETFPKKLTGKELFMMDHTMDDSDVKFLEEGEEVVEVDESLFEDIDELNLLDEDADNDEAPRPNLTFDDDDS